MRCNTYLRVGLKVPSKCTSLAPPPSPSYPGRCFLVFWSILNERSCACQSRVYRYTHTHTHTLRLTPANIHLYYRDERASERAIPHTRKNCAEKDYSIKNATYIKTAVFPSMCIYPVFGFCLGHGGWVSLVLQHTGYPGFGESKIDIRVCALWPYLVGRANRELNRSVCGGGGVRMKGGKCKQIENPHPVKHPLAPSPWHTTLYRVRGERDGCLSYIKREREWKAKSCIKSDPADNRFWRSINTSFVEIAGGWGGGRRKPSRNSCVGVCVGVV